AETSNALRKALWGSYRDAIQSCGATPDGASRTDGATHTDPGGELRDARRVALPAAPSARPARDRGAGRGSRAAAVRAASPDQGAGGARRGDHRHAGRAASDPTSQRSRAGGPLGEARDGGAATPRRRSPTGGGDAQGARPGRASSARPQLTGRIAHGSAGAGGDTATAHP